MKSAARVLLAAAVVAAITVRCSPGVPLSAEVEGVPPFPTAVPKTPTPVPAAPAAPRSAPAPAKTESRAAALASAGIPAHPDRLVYDPFTYTPPSAKDYRTVLSAGPVVYAAEDHELPLVTIQITVKGGTYLSPAGKEGLAETAGALLTSGGTRAHRAKDLDEELAFLAADLGSSFDVDRGTVRLQLLSKDLDRGLQILKEAMTEPAFEEERLALHKKQLVAEMKTRNDEAANIEGRTRSELVFGPDYFLNRLPTKKSVESITRADLAAFHRRVYDVRNFVVAASGDFDRKALLGKLETFFAGWPVKGEVSPPIPRPSRAKAAGVYLIDKDVNQGRVSIFVPGLSRGDPDWTAAEVMNEVLGGGGDSSRIYSAVRSDEGLAYSAGSTLTWSVWFPGSWRASFQSKSRSVTYASEIVLAEIRKMREAGPTEPELDLARRSLVETLARRFSTKDRVVDVLVDEEYTGRYASDPDYFARYRERHLAVTKDDCVRVARRLFADASPTIVVVGKKADILNPLPAHPVALKSLTTGPMTQLPLKDPLTMEPLGPTAPLAP